MVSQLQKACLGAVLTSILFAIEPVALATTVPTNTLPGAIIQSVQQNPKQQQSPNDVLSPKNHHNIQRFDQNNKRQSEGSTALRFHIKTIHVEGITLLNKSQVQTLISKFENTDGSLQYFQKLAQQLTDLYSQKGYITSYVYIPLQKVSNGVLLLKASEGVVGQINLEPGRFFKARAVQHRMTLKSGSIFNVHTLAKNLREIRENPDVQVNAKLNAGEHPGETDVDLKVTDHFPIHLQPSFNNLGRDPVGKFQFGLLATDNNILGFGDRLMTSSTFANGTYALVNHYELPLNSRGTKFSFDHAYSYSKLGQGYTSLDLLSYASIYTPSISQVLIDTDRFKASVDVNLDFKQMNSYVGPTHLFSDQIREFRPGLNLQEYDKYGITAVRHELGIGLGSLFDGTSGTQLLASRTGSGNKFFKYLGNFTRIQRLPASTIGILRAIVQLTPDRLLSSEQMQIGGAYTVRGYQEGQLIGDSGVVLSGEWRVPCFLIPKSWTIPGLPHESLRNNIQFVSFLDFGAAFVNFPDPTEAVETFGHSKYALGTGIGIRVQLTKHLVGRLDYAVPLLRPTGFGTVARKQTPRFHFGLEAPIF